MRRFLILAVIGIVVGRLLVSAIVSLSQTPTDHTAHFNEDKILEANMRLAPIPDAENPKLPQVSFPPMNISGAAAADIAGAAHPVVAVKKPALLPKKVVKDDDNAKRKKKLEDEKLKTAARPVIIQNPLITMQAPGAPISGGSQGLLTPNPTPAPVTPPPSGASANSGVSVAGWQEALVNRPTAALLASFEKMYQNKQITTAQYYTVLSAMQKSPVLVARQDAVTAAEIQQTSQSFQILADESQTETDGTTRAAALQGVNAYGNVSDLHVLSAALVSGDLNSKLEASTVLNTVVKAYTGGSNSAVAQNLFMPFVAILKSITISQVPAVLQTNARTVLSEITSLLGIASV